MSKFKIPIVPITTNKSIRFPNDVVDKVEKIIVGKNCTFTAFVIEAVRTARRNIASLLKRYVNVKMSFVISCQQRTRKSMKNMKKHYQI